MSCYMHVFLVVDYSFRWRTQPAVFFIYEVFVAAIHVDLNKSFEGKLKKHKFSPL